MSLCIFLMLHMHAPPKAPTAASWRQFHLAIHMSSALFHSVDDLVRLSVPNSGLCWSQSWKRCPYLGGCRMTVPILTGRLQDGHLVLPSAYTIYS